MIPLGTPVGETVLVSIWDEKGRCVYDKKSDCCNENRAVVIPANYIHSLPKGLYTVQLKSINNLYISKLIKL